MRTGCTSICSSAIKKILLNHITFVIENIFIVKFKNRKNEKCNKK